MTSPHLLTRNPDLATRNPQPGTRSPECGLCGLPCESSRFIRQDIRFCCAGCMNVYSILIESGLCQPGDDFRETELYQQSLRMGLISNGQIPSTASEVNRTVSPEAPGQEILIHVGGMWCASCAWLIEHVVSKEPGVIKAEAFFASDLVKVKFAPQCLPPTRLIERIEQLGYHASEFTGEEGTRDEEKRDLLLRLGLSGFLWLNIMTLSTALYVGYFEIIAESIRLYLPFVLMVLATPVVFYSASPILKLGYQALRNRTLRMESLLGLGILAAYFYSAVQAFQSGIHIYFDTVCAIVTLVLIGKYIERTAKDRTSQAVTLLYRLMPKKVRLYSNGQERFVSIDALRVEDCFLVKAGERIPADGVVIDGHSFADESLLTGESTPVTKQTDSPVIAGSLNGSGVLRVRATKVGNDTTLAQIVHCVEQALSGRSPIERQVDRVSQVFIPSVIVVAAVTFLMCVWLGHPTGDSLMRAITVLVIACPCALGMATPLAMTTAIGTASQTGILVSDGSVLESVKTIDTIVLDKTGTVTEGQFSLVGVELCAEPLIPTGLDGHRHAPASSHPELFRQVYLPLLASLEAYSEHPLGIALRKYAVEQGVTLCEATEIVIHQGQGISGTVDRQRVFLGNRGLLEHLAGPTAPVFESLQALEWEADGHTVVFFGLETQLCGLLAFGDCLKTDSIEAVRAFQQQGVTVHLVSGDSQATVRAVGNQIGADQVLAEVSPAEKASYIQTLQDQGRVVCMVGDGINDAPALAQANLGVALSSGTDIAMQAASVVLISHSLNKILDVFDLSHKTRRVIRQNLFWAFLYNSLGIGLAVTGILNPILAAGAMVLSSLSVITNSLRLRNIGH